MTPVNVTNSLPIHLIIFPLLNAWSTAGKMFRIGHMGNIDDHTVYSTIAAIERTLIKLGYKYEVGIGLKTLLETM